MASLPALPAHNAARYIDKAMIGCLSAVFLFAGVDKILHYEGFVNALRDYALVPGGMAPLLANPVIILEVLVGSGLLIRGWRSAAALTAVATLAVFTFALSIDHLYGGRGICGCWFTITLAKGTGMHIAQNLMMMTLAFFVWREARYRRQPIALPPMQSGHTTGA